MLLRVSKVTIAGRTCCESAVLTPKQRFRQLEPSWPVNGQTTSLLASEAEKELVREDRGGIASQRGGF